MPLFFSDVPESLAEYADAMYFENITTGCASRTSVTDPRPKYCPNDNVTRAQMAVFLTRAAGIEPYNKDTPTFSDVPKTHSAYQYIEAAYKAGITGGCKTNPLRYCPDDPVTREQMAAFLQRAGGIPLINPTTPTFADVPKTSSFYQAIETIVSKNITSGCRIEGSTKYYCPKDNVTRGQMAVFLTRTFLTKIQGYVKEQRADDSIGDKIGGAKVLDQNGRSLFVTASDTNPGYYFRYLKKGKYTIKAAKDTYIYTNTNSFELQYGWQMREDSTFSSWRPDLLLKQAGTLRGKVYLQDTLHPISGVRVKTTINNQQYYGATNASGDYSFLLPIGTAWVEVGYSAYSYPTIKQAQINWNQNTTLNFQFPDGFPSESHGRVTNSSGNPMPGAIIVLDAGDAADMPGFQIAVADDSGNYQAEGLLNGVLYDTTVFYQDQEYSFPDPANNLVSFNNGSQSFDFSGLVLSSSSGSYQDNNSKKQFSLEILEKFLGIARAQATGRKVHSLEFKKIVRNYLLNYRSPRDGAQLTRGRKEKDGGRNKVGDVMAQLEKDNYFKKSYLERIYYLRTDQHFPHIYKPILLPFEQQNRYFVYVGNVNYEGVVKSDYSLAKDFYNQAKIVCLEPLPDILVDWTLGDNVIRNLAFKKVAAYPVMGHLSIEQNYDLELLPKNEITQDLDKIYRTARMDKFTKPPYSYRNLTTWTSEEITELNKVNDITLAVKQYLSQNPQSSVCEARSYAHAMKVSEWHALAAGLLLPGASAEAGTLTRSIGRFGILKPRTLPQTSLTLPSGQVITSLGRRFVAQDSKLTGSQLTEAITRVHVVLDAIENKIGSPIFQNVEIRFVRAKDPRFPLGFSGKYLNPALGDAVDRVTILLDEEIFKSPEGAYYVITHEGFHHVDWFLRGTTGGGFSESFIDGSIRSFIFERWGIKISEHYRASIYTGSLKNLASKKLGSETLGYQRIEDIFWQARNFQQSFDDLFGSGFYQPLEGYLNMWGYYLSLCSEGAGGLNVRNLEQMSLYEERAYNYLLNYPIR